MSESLDEQVRRHDRMEAEALARSERLFSDTMVESMPGILYFYDMQGRFLRWNKNFEKVSGYSSEEIARMHPLDFFTQADKGLLEERIAEVFTKGESTVEALFLAKDGQTTPYFFTGRKVEFDGRLCLVGVGIDVSERRLAEAALRESEHRYRTTLDSILEGCQLVGFDGRYLYVNDAAVSHNRRPKGDLLGRKMTEVWPGIEQAPFYALIERGLKQRIPGLDEVEFSFPDGTKGWFDLRVQPVDEGVLLLSVEKTLQKQASDRMRESERKYRELVENANSIILRWSSEGRITLLNEFGLRFFGYTAEEIIGQHLVGLIVPATESSGRDLRHLMEQICADPKAFEQNINENIRRNGERVWISWTNRIVLDDQGKLLEILSIGTDITEQRRANEALRRSEEQFRLIMENVADLVALLDVEGRRLYNSPSYQRILGSTRELLGSSSFDNIHPDDLPKVREIFADTVRNGVGARLEYRLLDQSNDSRHIESQGSVIRDELGRTTQVVVVSRDVTERKQAELALREQATLLDKAQDAIIVLDLECHVVFWNQSAERLYGLSTTEALGCPVPGFFTKDAAVFQVATETTLKTGEWVGELEQANKTGAAIVTESRWTLVGDNEGRPKSFLVINTDITQRKKLEEQFLRVQRMESIGTLAGGIAHDLNNVLSPILMSIQLLKLDEEDPAKLNTLDIIETSANRGAAMVGQVLSFARGVEGRRIEVQVRHLIRDIVKISRETFPKNIRLESKMAGDLWSLKADPTQLHQVLLNLCVNARDAMLNGGKIIIRAENMMIDEHYAAMNIEARIGPYVQIEVEDNGAGIPEHVIDKIFDPFFTTKEPGKGTGLGLSTVLAIIKSHKGFVRVYSEPGNGTKFCIYFPAQTAATASESETGQVDLPKGKGEMIMVVDDEETIRQITKRTLEAFGYNVVVAGDGSEAVSVYAQNQQEIVLVITDMMMPVLDGLATIQVLRRMNPNLRIISASGITTEAKVAQAKALGAKHFLAKPYTAETLLKAVKTVLSQTGAE